MLIKHQRKYKTKIELSVCVSNDPQQKEWQQRQVYQSTYIYPYKKFQVIYDSKCNIYIDMYLLLFSLLLMLLFVLT